MKIIASQGGFLFMRIFILSLCVLFTIPVFASESIITYSSPYIQAHNSPVLLKFAPSCGVYASNCVLYVKCRMGRLNESWGVAKNIEPTTQIPYIGGAILTLEGPLGHVGYIENIKDGKLYISEANYISGQVSTRSLSLDDLVIRGFR